MKVQNLILSSFLAVSAAAFAQDAPDAAPSSIPTAGNEGVAAHPKAKARAPHKRQRHAARLKQADPAAPRTD